MSYVVTTKEEQQKMLHDLGLEKMDDLFKDVPSQVFLKTPLKMDEGISEFEVLKDLEKKANKNVVYESSFRGVGSYKHLIPEVVKHLSNLNGFVTSYTPYQAEISQGNLQTIFEYQTEICNLFDMEVSNASVYDGASAAAESMLMTLHKKKNKFLIASSLNKNVIEVLKTYAFAKNIELEFIEVENGLVSLKDLKNKVNKDVMGLIYQSPNYFGLIEDQEKIVQIAHEKEIQVISYSSPICNAIIKTPGECNVDIVCGEGQSLGLDQGFGGPYLGFMATTKKNMRKLPGRIVGQTIDENGKVSYVLTLQAREQHIRREKASSSICSNQALAALRSSIYMGALGKQGLKEVAIQCISKAHYAMEKICDIEGFYLKYDSEFFDEFVVNTPISVDLINDKLKKQKIEGPYKLSSNSMIVCVTEALSKKQIDDFVLVLKELSL